MKLHACVLGLAMSLAMAHGGFAAKKEPRLLEFAGNYTGTIIYGGAYSGTTMGKFTASKKKDVGTLTLNSVIPVGGTTLVINETFQINRKLMTYSISAGGDTGIGTGTVNVGKKFISYSASFAVGSGTFFVTGTIAKSGKRGLTITESLSSSSNFTLPISYALTKQGKK